MPPIHSALRPSLLFRTPLARTFTTTPQNHLAKISIVGRLAGEPELLPTSSGQDMIKYALGTKYGPRDNQQTSWWKVTAFPREGTSVKDRLLACGKGSLLYVEGSCKMDSFTDKEGNQRSALNIVQGQLEVLDRRESNGEGSSGNDGSPNIQDHQQS
ncbi:MAG: hypothetical protein Q9218_007830 [Villophora microphyllina]